MLRDLTGQAPVRRMAVVRGRLRLPTGIRVPDDALGVARAAASQAAKSAAMTLPLQHAVQPTHLEVAFEVKDTVVTCTVTLQAFARADVDGQALLSCAVALLTVRDAVGRGRIEELDTVQNVSGA